MMIACLLSAVTILLFASDAVSSLTITLCATGHYCSGDGLKISSKQASQTACANACHSLSSSYVYFDFYVTNSDGGTIGDCWCGASCGFFATDPGTDTYSINGAMCSTVSPTYAPTVLNPTNPPSEKPTMTPTTADPTIVPSTPPSVYPTMDPSASPTVGPTVIPTVLPTTSPTLTPTLRPTANPTLVPTTAPTLVPTVNPTAVPTASPTLVPTAAPTIRPTLATFVNYKMTLQVAQTVYFMSQAEYAANQAAYNVTIQSTVAGVLSGVVPTDITNIVVTADDQPSNSQGLRSMAASVVEHHCGLTYTVTVHDPTITYDTVTSQLQTAVHNGGMTAQFRTYANQYGVATNSNASFVYVAFPEPRSTAALTGTEIAGVAIGACLGLIFIVLLAYYVYAHYQRTQKPALETVEVEMVANENI